MKRPGLARVKTGRLCGVLELRIVASSESGPSSLRLIESRTSCRCWQVSQTTLSEAVGGSPNPAKVGLLHPNAGQSSRWDCSFNKCSMTRSCPSPLRSARTPGTVCLRASGLAGSQPLRHLGPSLLKFGEHFGRVATSDALLDPP